MGSRRLGTFRQVPHGCNRSFFCNVSHLPAVSNKDSALSSAGESIVSLLSPLLSAFHKTGRNQELYPAAELAGDALLGMVWGVTKQVSRAWLRIVFSQKCRKGE